MILNLSLSAPQLPNAGRAFADKCEYDHATRTVTIHARNPQAGEVKDPEGETRTFKINVPEPPPEVKGVVYLYRTSNNGDPEGVWTDTKDFEQVVVNGESYYTVAETAFELPEGGYDNMHSTVCSKVKPLPSEGIIDMVPLNAEHPNRLKYSENAFISFSSEGYIVISRDVEVVEVL